MSFAPGDGYSSVHGASGGAGTFDEWFATLGSGHDWGAQSGPIDAMDFARAAYASYMASRMQQGGTNEVHTVLPGPVEPAPGGTGVGPIVPTDAIGAFPVGFDQGLEDWGAGVDLPGWVYQPIPDAPGTLDTTSPGWGVAEEEPNMAVDWTSVLNTAITGYQQPSFSGGGASGSYAPPMPAQVTVDTRTGQVKPCRRRRRRRLLTPTDLSDLAALSAIVGKGDALKLAVAKAVRR